MLVEIALTPHTLQPCTLDVSGWAGHLRALNLRLAHFGQQCPLVFSNLNNGGRNPNWEQRIRSVLAGWRPTEHRPVRDLFDYLLQKKLLVARPAHGCVRTESGERHWVDDAIRPTPDYPVNQIVVSRTGEVECRRSFTKVVGLHSLDQAAFWSDVATAAEFGTAIQTQVTGLRPIWLHGQFLSVVLPYGLTQEADWFFEFASRAFGRPAGHGVPKLEFHVSYGGNDQIGVKQQGGSHPEVADFISAARRQVGLRNHEFSMFVRAKSNGSQRFIARRLFAGEEAIEDPSKPEVRVRWGVAVEHVALFNESPKQTPPTFTLLPRQRADDQFHFECRELGARLAGPIRVQC